MEYSTYWSVLEAPGNTIKSNSISLYIAIGAFILWFLIKKFKKENEEGDKTILLWGTGTFAVLGLVGFIIMTFFYSPTSDNKFIELLNSSSTPRIEGVISDFERTFRHTKYGVVTTEMFKVDSVQFVYTDAALAKFIEFTHVKNNVIFNGQKVRITYYSPFEDNHNTILKLEIAK